MRSQNEIVLAAGRHLSLEERIRANREYKSERLEPNTKRAYQSDIRMWEHFCHERGYTPHPVNEVSFEEYVRYLETERRNAYKTVQRRVYGLIGAYKDADLPIDRKAVQKALEALEVARKRIMKEPGTRGRGKARAFTVEELRAMSAACPDSLRGVRDRALALLGFAIGARRSELANLHASDVTEVPAGLEVHIRWSKVHEERWPKVPYGQHLETCPVRAWKAWLAAASITEGPAFRRIDRHGNLGASITPEGVGDAITELAACAGLGKRTAHGLRSGMATEGRRAKHDAVAIARQGGWTKHSREMLGYMQVIDEWEDNPLYGIGL